MSKIAQSNTQNNNKPTMVDFRRFTDEELFKLNLKRLRICPNMFVGGSIIRYSDGSNVATFGLDDEWVAKSNAKQIGKLILELFPYVDAVEKDGIVITRDTK